MKTPQAQSQDSEPHAETLAGVGQPGGAEEGEEVMGVELELPSFIVESLDPLLPRDIWQPLSDPVLDGAIQHFVISQLLLDDEVRRAMRKAAEVPIKWRIQHAYPIVTERNDWPVDWQGEWQGVDLIYAAAHAVHRLLVLEPAWIFTAGDALPDGFYATHVIDFEDVGGSCVAYGTLRGVPVRVGLIWRTDFSATDEGTTRFCLPEHDLRVTVRREDEPVLRQRFSDLVS